jgi:hypothetical protein
MTLPRLVPVALLGVLGLTLTAAAQPPRPGQPGQPATPGQPGQPTPPAPPGVMPQRPTPPTNPGPLPPRHDRFERLVTGWVVSYLGRQPTPRELTTLVSQLRSGVSPFRVQANILSSNEYFMRNGGFLPGFARALLRDVASRPGTPQEVQELVILAGNQGRYAAALAVVTAAEARPPVVVPVPVPVVPVTPGWLWW